MIYCYIILVLLQVFSEYLNLFNLAIYIFMFII